MREREDGDFWRSVATRARAIGDGRYRGLGWGLPGVLADWVGAGGAEEDTVFDDGG